MVFDSVVYRQMQDLAAREHLRDVLAVNLFGAGGKQYFSAGVGVDDPARFVEQDDGRRQMLKAGKGRWDMLLYHDSCYKQKLGQKTQTN